MRILARLRAVSLTVTTVVLQSAITSCNALDISGLNEAFSSSLTSIGVTSGGIVEVGDTIRLNASGSVSGIIGIFSYAPILDAQWSVSDPLIARLELLPPPPAEDSFPQARVLVRGLKPGKATVSAQSQGIRGSAEVRVIQHIEHIDVRVSRDTLFVGDTIPITTTVFDSNGLAITELPLALEISEGLRFTTFTGERRVTAIASGPARVTARFRRAAGTLELTVLAR